MTPQERKFIEAADEIYSAIVEAASRQLFTVRLAKAKKEFANASNGWGDHPAKLEDAARRAAKPQT
jgi:hypothetical protein